MKTGNKIEGIVGPGGEDRLVLTFELIDTAGVFTGKLTLADQLDHDTDADPSIDPFGEDFVPSKENLPSIEEAWDWVRGFVEEHREAAQAVGG